MMNTFRTLLNVDLLSVTYYFIQIVYKMADFYSSARKKFYVWLCVKMGLVQLFLVVEDADLMSIVKRTILLNGPLFRLKMRSTFGLYP